MKPDGPRARDRGVLEREQARLKDVTIRSCIGPIAHAIGVRHAPDAHHPHKSLQTPALRHALRAYIRAHHGHRWDTLTRA